MEPRLDREALRFILDTALEKENDGAGCGPFIGYNAGTIVETLMWLDQQGFLDERRLMAFGDQHWQQFDVDPLWALDELERVVGAEALASSPGPYNLPEWDYLLALPRRTRQRLTGAQYMRRGAMQPDQLAELIVARVAEVETVDDAMEWYVKTCLAAIDEARLLAHRRRHLAVARRNGHQTYYQHRSEYARSLGYGSLWDMRRRKKWK